MRPDVPPLITVDEAAQLLRVTTTDIEHGVRAGDIPVTAHDGQLFIDAHALLADFGVWPNKPTSFRLTDAGQRLLDATEEHTS